MSDLLGQKISVSDLLVAAIVAVLIDKFFKITSKGFNFIADTFARRSGSALERRLVHLERMVEH